MITTITICLLAYLIPMLYNFYWVRYVYYHPRGKWNGCTPDYSDYFIVFCPLVNIVMFFAHMFTSPLEISKIKPKINNNIFKPKKPLKDET